MRRGPRIKRLTFDKPRKSLKEKRELAGGSLPFATRRTRANAEPARPLAQRAGSDRGRAATVTGRLLKYELINSQSSIKRMR